MTWIDMYFTNFMSNLMIYGKALLGTEMDMGQYPKLQDLMNKVTGHPKIADWIKRRPVTEY